MANSDIDFNNTTDFGTVKIRMLQGAKGEKGEAGQDGVSGDYAGLINKPQINGETLTGNKTTEDLGLLSEMELNTFKDEVEASFTETNGNLTDLQDALTQFEGDTAYNFEQVDERLDEDDRVLAEVQLALDDRYTKEDMQTLFYRVRHLGRAWTEQRNISKWTSTSWTFELPEELSDGNYSPIAVQIENPAFAAVNKTDSGGYFGVLSNTHVTMLRSSNKIVLSGDVVFPNLDNSFTGYIGIYMPTITFVKNDFATTIWVEEYDD